MATNVKETTYGAPAKQILAMPDHYVAIGMKQEQINSANFNTAGGIVVSENGRFLVKAGTIFPANDGTAIGVVLNDYDVTDFDKQMAVVIHGFIKTAALPTAPSAAAKTALKQITFLDPVT